MNRLGLYLGLFSLALAAWSAQGLLARGFYARGKAWFPTWLGTGIMVLSVPLYLILGRRFGGVGKSYTDVDLDTLQPATEVAEEIVAKLTPKQLAPR